MLLAEKESVLDDFHHNTLSVEAFNALLGSIDARLAGLDVQPASSTRPNWNAVLVEVVRVLRPGDIYVYADRVVPSWLARIGRL